MVLFWSDNIDGSLVYLNQEESSHCVRVLRHRTGDIISVIDGKGNLYTCTLVDDNSKSASAKIIEVQHGFGAHPYHLTMAVCPTKNSDRFEWFAEKATEIGVDVFAPLVGEHSERKVLNTERVKKIVLSASKQSLKGSVPQVCDPVDILSFIKNAPSDTVKLICYCFEGDRKRQSICEALAQAGASNNKDVIILIGPEGDFSPREVEEAFTQGFIPVHLGDSRLRTETAAVVATTSVYLHYCLLCKTW